MKRNEIATEVIDHLVIAEASAWLLRLQDDGGDAGKAAFREWLDADPAHARAFARVNDVWDQIPGAVAPSARPRSTAPRRLRGLRHGWVGVAAACAAAVLVVIAVGRGGWPHADTGYATAVGQQQTITLADGSRITLNTGTQITVAYRRDARHVRLLHGEALFHVQENPRRPFVLDVAGQRVVDLGTTFDVTHYRDPVAVTLLEGKVRITPARADAGQESADAVTLEPGERLTVAGNATPVIDRPDLQGVTAWQRGRVYFNATSLGDAVEQLARYGGIRIEVRDPALAGLRVSGVFSTHDPAQFAAAVADLHGLRLERRAGAIELVR